MVRGSRRARFTGSALVRLLARLADAEVAESRQAFADRVGQWLDWTHAIPLSAALDGRPAAAPPRAGAAPCASAEEGEFARVRAALAGAAATDDDAALLLPEFAPYRRHYVARQQAMETAIGPLRARLRDALARTSPAMARLAAVDAVMEQALAAQERTLLATVPAWLGRRFERLRKAHRAAAADACAPDDTHAECDPGGWLDVFRRDLHAVLLAELELRLQPAEGLLDALRTQPRPT